MSDTNLSPIRRAAHGSAQPAAPRNSNPGTRSSLALRLAAVCPLDAEELDALNAVRGRIVRYKRGEHVIRTGDACGSIYVLEDGWAFRYKLLLDGRRQIARFLLPGDIVCSEALAFRRSDHGIGALTPVTSVAIDAANLIELFASFPRLAFALASLRMQEEAFLVERIVSLGRRSALERVAHLLIELWTRLRAVGLADERAFEIPVSQELLADALGMTPVHMNRTMQQLRKAGLIRVEAGHPPKRIVLLDINRLKRAASFEPAYLHVDDRRGAPQPDAAAGRVGWPPLRAQDPDRHEARLHS